MLNENDVAPDFELLDDTGTLRRLSNYRGQIVVLYFYPKDDTPGCTTEACHFRDDYSAYFKSDAVILGVSPDDMKAHTQFKKKYDLPDCLLWCQDREYVLFGVEMKEFTDGVDGPGLNVTMNSKPCRIPRRGPHGSSRPTRPCGPCRP